MFAAIISQAIKFGVVFLYGSTGEIIIEKSGHLNLGIPGTMCIGAIGGCLGANFAYNAGSGAFGVIIMALICSMIFGGMVGTLYGFFTITLRCNQNVTGLTITTFGAGLLGFWINKMGQKGIRFYNVSRIFTESMFGTSGDNWFTQIFFSHGTLVYVGIIIAVIAALVLKRTRTGLSITAVGENPAAADAAGINVIKYKYVACILGSAIAGIGGAFYYLDCTRGSLEPGVVEAMGWLAVALVIFSLWRPGICIFGSFVFGLLYILPNYIDGVDLATKEIINIIPYCVTAFVLIFISFFNKKETQPPTALGLSYFREER